MKVRAAALSGVLHIDPAVHRDERGYFLETYQAERYREAGLPERWVQDNLSCSARGVVRGLHFQRPPHAQAKLVGVLRGEIFDVVVDLRAGSPSFGRWYGARLDGESGGQLYVPAGFAHGFCALSEGALVSYKCSAPYAPGSERTLLWNDPALAVEWPLREAQLSPKDARGLPLAALEPADFLPYAAV